MRSNNICTEKHLDAASEPGVVGSGCGWLHGAGILPELQNVEEYLSSHVSASPRDLQEGTRRSGDRLLEKAGGGGAILGSNGASYRTLDTLFGIVCAIVHDFCKSVHQVLMPDCIKLPQGDDLQEVLRGFRQRFPQCAGQSTGAVQRGSE